MGLSVFCASNERGRSEFFHCGKVKWGSRFMSPYLKLEVLLTLKEYTKSKQGSLLVVAIATLIKL